MARFAHRVVAGQELASALAAYREELTDGIVLGIPRGGIVVAAEVARALNLPLAPLVVAKIGAPGNPEYAVGAVGPDGQPVVDESTGNEDADELQRSIMSAQAKVVSLQAELGQLETTQITGRPVVIVDDGLATGRTMGRALRWIQKQKPLRVIVAVPVASADTTEALKPLADRVIVLHEPIWFGGVAAFYDDFPQVTTSEARASLSDVSERC